MIERHSITIEKLKELYASINYDSGTAYLRTFTNSLSTGDCITNEFIDLAEVSKIPLTPDQRSTYYPKNIGVYTFSNRRSLMYDRPYVLLVKEDVDIELVPSFADKMIPVLERLMKNRYFINNEKLYLYYPEFTITNTIGESHLIKDLVVRITTTETGFLPYLTGHRYSFTQQELDRGYCHSHLPTYGFNNSSFDEFCLGSGSPFSTYINRINNGCTQEQFEMLLVQIEQYLVWESIEGSPHISISKFYERNRPSITRAISDAGIRNMAIEMLKSIKPEWLTQDTLTSWVLNPNVTPEIANEVLMLELDTTNRYQSNGVFSRDTLMRYSVNNSTYVSSNASGSQRLPGIANNSEVGLVLDNLKINPHIYTENLLANSDNSIVSRLKPGDINALYENINTLLNNANKINGEDSINSESKDSNNEELSFASSSPAQPVPAG